MSSARERRAGVMNVWPETNWEDGTVELGARETMMASLPMAAGSVAQDEGSVGGAET